jgi:predicted Zn-dependent protease
VTAGGWGYSGHSAAGKRSTIAAARLNGVDDADALAGAQRDRFDVGVDARERQVARITRYARGDLLERSSTKR